MLTFTDLAATLDAIRNHIASEQCFTISPDILHVSLQPVPTDVADRLRELGWVPSPVYPNVWDCSTVGAPE